MKRYYEHHHDATNLVRRSSTQNGTQSISGRRIRQDGISSLLNRNLEVARLTLISQSCNRKPSIEMPVRQKVP